MTSLTVGLEATEADSAKMTAKSKRTADTTYNIAFFTLTASGVVGCYPGKYEDKYSFVYVVFESRLVFPVDWASPRSVNTRRTI